MSLIKWQDGFRIGIEAVDHEHEELIGVINATYEELEKQGGPAVADMATLSRWLGEIEAQVSAHFALEEREMRELRYPDYAAHKADHEMLLDDIAAIADAAEAGSYKDLGDRLASDLTRWFSVHFRTRDADLHHFLAKHQL